MPEITETTLQYRDRLRLHFVNRIRKINHQESIHVSVAAIAGDHEQFYDIENRHKEWI
jgi:hypothetical protein